MMRTHLANQGLGSHETELIHAVVAGHDGIGYFETGFAQEWWGQTLRDRPDSPVGLPWPSCAR
jgi:hypothetical protein